MAIAPSVALWAGDDDLSAQRVRDRLRARGHDVIAVTPTATADATDLSAWVVAGADLDSCDAHLVRALPSPIAVPAPGDDAVALARRAFQGQERLLLAQAALAVVEARGGRVLNPCSSLPFESKALQLATFARAGLPVPRTLITGMPLAAERFVDALAAEGRAVIAKPLIGGSTARLIDGAARARLGALGPSPVILQERVAGDDVRVTVVDGAVVSAVVIASAALDYRDDPAYAAGGARYQPTELSDEARAVAVRAATLCGHAISGVDLKRTPASAVVVLEANAAPQWADIEDKTGAAITDAVMVALLR